MEDKGRTAGMESQHQVKNNPLSRLLLSSANSDDEYRDAEDYPDLNVNGSAASSGEQHAEEDQMFMPAASSHDVLLKTSINPKPTERITASVIRITFDPSSSNDKVEKLSSRSTIETTEEPPSGLNETLSNMIASIRSRSSIYQSATQQTRGRILPPVLGSGNCTPNKYSSEILAIYVSPSDEALTESLETQNDTQVKKEQVSNGSPRQTPKRASQIDQVQQAWPEKLPNDGCAKNKEVTELSSESSNLVEGIGIAFHSCTCTIDNEAKRDALACRNTIVCHCTKNREGKGNACNEWEKNEGITELSNKSDHLNLLKGSAIAFHCCTCTIHKNTKRNTSACCNAIVCHNKREEQKDPDITSRSAYQYQEEFVQREQKGSLSAHTCGTCKQTTSMRSVGLQSNIALDVSKDITNTEDVAVPSKISQFQQTVAASERDDWCQNQCTCSRSEQVPVGQQNKQPYGVTQDSPITCTCSTYRQADQLHLTDHSACTCSPSKVSTSNEPCDIDPTSLSYKCTCSAYTTGIWEEASCTFLCTCPNKEGTPNQRGCTCNKDNTTSSNIKNLCTCGPLRPQVKITPPSFTSANVYKCTCESTANQQASCNPVKDNNCKTVAENNSKPTPQDSPCCSTNPSTLNCSTTRHFPAPGRYTNH